MFRITSVAGHIMELDLPSQLQDWGSCDPYEIFSCKVRKKPASTGVVKHLEEVGRNVTSLVLWTDCDREGENIGAEIIGIVEKRMIPAKPITEYFYVGNPKRKIPYTGHSEIYRAYFSALAPKDIEHALANLIRPNLWEASSVDARQELDLKVGVAFSRFQTQSLQAKYTELSKGGVISYGPCQTPTLSFIVDRHDAIQAFTPETHWTLSMAVKVPSATGGFVEVPVTWDRGVIFDIHVVNMFHGLVKEYDSAGVTSIEVKNGVSGRPVALNTPNLLKKASSQLGLGPHEALNLAERLYLSGLLSYPRTESTAYPSSFDLRGAVCELTSDGGEIGSYSRALLEAGLAPSRGGEDKGDHPPITPMRSPAPGELHGDLLRLYNMVARHFLATVSGDAIFEDTVVSLQVAGEEFTCRGRRIIEPGWKGILGKEIEDMDSHLPEFSKGALVPISYAHIKEGKTSPPGHLTESDLITLMETYEIGTDASMATHINNVQQRNYATLGSGRTLIPTQLGLLLLHGLYSIDPEVVLPSVRREIEAQCALVAEGKASQSEIVHHGLTIFAQKYLYVTQNWHKADRLFESVFEASAATGKPLTRCGGCRRYMTLVTLRPQRLYCGHCNFVYLLPQNGVIRPAPGNPTCPLDGFELVTYSLGNTRGAHGKQSLVCPKCYNGGQDIEELTCIQCAHPTCPHSSVNFKVLPCPGMEVLRTKQLGKKGGATVIGVIEEVLEESDFYEHDLKAEKCGGHFTKRAADDEDEEDDDGSDDGSESGEEERGCDGYLVLDTLSKPHWRLVCNSASCHIMVRMTAKGPIQSVSVLTDKAPCPTCNAPLLAITPTPGGAAEALCGGTTVTGCIACDSGIASLCEIRYGRQRHKNITVGGRGRGRGRGRGGRGRREGGRGGGRQDVRRGGRR